MSHNDSYEKVKDESWWLMRESNGKEKGKENEKMIRDVTWGNARAAQETCHAQVGALMITVTQLFWCKNCVTDVYIFPYFAVFYTDLFGEDLVFESLSLDVIR